MSSNPIHWRYGNHPGRHRVLDGQEPDRVQAVIPQGCTSAEDRLRYYVSQSPTWRWIPAIARCLRRGTPNCGSSARRASSPSTSKHRVFAGRRAPEQALPKGIAAAFKSHFAFKKSIYCKDLPDEIRDDLWSRFERGTRPLQDAGKLTTVHCQFPPWVTHGNRTYAHM